MRFSITFYILYFFVDIDYYKKMSINKKQEFIEKRKQRIENIRTSYRNRKFWEDVLSRIEK